MTDMMHPCLFRDTWRLTNWETALALGLSERTIVAYCASPNSVSRRNPSSSVERITFIKHQAFLAERKLPSHCGR
jgi:hypothetical protein